MYYYTYNTHILAAAGIVGILVIAVVLTALLAVLVLPKHKDGKLPAFFQLLFDAFTPKTLLLEKILQVLNVFFSLVAVLLGLVLHAPIAIFCFIMATESALKVPFGLHRIRSGKWIHDVTQDLNA